MDVLVVSDGGDGYGDEGTTRERRERAEVTSAWRWGDAKPKTENCHDEFSYVHYYIIILCELQLYSCTGNSREEQP